MSSALERALLRLQVFSQGPCLGYFLKTQLSVDDMLNLRLTSRSLYRLSELSKMAFDTIYVHTPVPPGRGQHFDAFENIALPCRNLVVKIAFPAQVSHSPQKSTSSEPISMVAKSASSSDALSDIIDSYYPYPEPPIAWKFVVQRKPGDIDQALLEQWYKIFMLCPNIETLQIACNGDPSWPGCTDIEAVLVILRIALERTNPEHLHTVRLSPIHAMGIMHLRWAGAGAYGDAPASPNPIWQRLKVLLLQIYNPYIEGRLSKSQKQLFDKVFADYLQSFSQTLTRLDLSWIGADGPNPFFVEEARSSLRLSKPWRNLEELWFRGVVVNRHSCAATRELAPHLQRLMVPKVESSEEDRAGHVVWSDCLDQENGKEVGDTGCWKTLQGVRLSAIPDPLFRGRLT